MSSILDFMKAFAGNGIAGDVTRPAGIGRSETGASGISAMPLRNGNTVGMQRMLNRSMQPMQPMQQPPQPTISTPQEYWLRLGQGKMGRDQDLEKMLGIGTQNALAAYLPFLGLK